MQLHRAVLNLLLFLFLFWPKKILSKVYGLRSKCLMNEAFCLKDSDLSEQGELIVQALAMAIACITKKWDV